MSWAQGWAEREIASSVCHGTLEIDGHSMNRAAWATLNNFVLWTPASVIGDDLVIPHRDGVVALRRRKTVTKQSIQLLIIGQVDYAGTPNDDPIVGVEENMDFLDTYIFAPVISDSGTRTAVLTLPSGATRTGQVHIENVVLGSTIAGALTATFDISLPYGELGAPSGS